MASKRPPKRTSKRSTAKRPKKSRAPKSSLRRERTAPVVVLKRAGRIFFRSLLAATLAAGVGGALVAYGLYHQAETQVEETLAGDMWELPGKVYSAPIEVWPGLTTSAEDLAVDLQSAGYARVSEPSQPGDFAVTGDSLLVIREATSGPGWEVPAGEVLITFRDGRVRSISPSRTAVLPPAVLASVRGQDNEERTPRGLDDFPEHLTHAVLAMEDARFYDHKGISAFGLLRALLVNAREGAAVQGGSTLTQQLAKNLFLTQERTLSRKGHEMLLAFALERELSKEEILALYLNEIYWGQAGGVAICGADEAARVYFSKPVDRLDLGEAATLAGIISSPNGYNPLRHPERAKERRDLALRRMMEVGWLDPDVAEAEMAKPLQVQPGVTHRRAPYAVDAAMDATEAALGEGSVAEQGLGIHTTIHPPLQRLAEEVVALSVSRLEEAYPQVEGVQMALVAVRVSDGAVVAMVGGRDYGESQYNRALLAERAPGSTVKPLTLLTAFDADPSLGPASTVLDEPIERIVDGKTWTPANYDGTYDGEITLREAINRSRNIPAVLLAEQLGYGKLQRAYQQLGLTGATSLPSASLGAFEATPIELAGAYTVFPGQGQVAQPTYLRAVADAEGALLVNNEPIKLRQASPRAAALSTSVLESVITDGTGARARRFGATGAIGGKTGTTDDYRDAWFVGFSPELAVAVWVGFDQGGSLGLTGSKAALPAWSRFMGGSGTTGGAFVVPNSVIEAEFCLSGAFEAGLCTECGTELYSAGFEPQNGCQQPLIEELLDRLRVTPKSSPHITDAEAEEVTRPRLWPFRR